MSAKSSKALQIDFLTTLSHSTNEGSVECLGLFRASLTPEEFPCLHFPSLSSIPVITSFILWEMVVKTTTLRLQETLQEILFLETKFVRDEINFIPKNTFQR